MDDTTIVRAMLDHARLSPPPEEVERLVKLYRGIRSQLDRIYEVDVDDTDPASVFRAEEVGP